MLEDFEDEDVKEEENLEGFTIVDESGQELEAKKVDAIKVFKKIVEDPTLAIATPILDNEQKVILYNTIEVLPEINSILELRILDTEGAVYFANQKVGDFKTMFVKKLHQEKANMFAIAKLISVDAPVMVLIQFSVVEKKNSIKIEGAKIDPALIKSFNTENI